MKWLIVFYTSEPKAPEVYGLHQVMEFLTRLHELTRSKAKHAVYEIGACVGDFS